MNYNWIIYNSEQESIFLDKLRSLNEDNIHSDDDIAIFNVETKRLYYNSSILLVAYNLYNKTISEYGKIVNDYLGIPPGTFTLIDVFSED